MLCKNNPMLVCQYNKIYPTGITTRILCSKKLNFLVMNKTKQHSDKLASSQLRGCL